MVGVSDPWEKNKSVLPLWSWLPYYALQLGPGRQIIIEQLSPWKSLLFSASENSQVTVQRSKALSLGTESVFLRGSTDGHDGHRG